MAEETRRRRYAVLIDAENVQSDIADALFDEIASFGEATVRRVYGNFRGDHLKGWSAVLDRLPIEAVQVVAPVKRKNAADIALVIDAMDLLHGGRVDGFCLVSSDSDFTGLAIRLRASGAVVIGYGRSQTPKGFQQAFTRFDPLPDQLRRSPVAGHAVASQSTPVLLEPGPPKTAPPKTAPPKTAPPKTAPPKAPSGGHPPSKAVPKIKKALKELAKRRIRAELDTLEAECLKMDDGFKAESYKATSFRSLVETSGGFDIRSGVVQVRAHKAKPQAKRPAP